MTGDPDRGRFELIGLSVLAASTLFVISVLAWLRGGTVNWVVGVGRPVVVIAFALLALGGRRWARTLLVWWTGFLAVVLAVSSIAAMGIKTSAGIMMLALALMFGAVAFRLFSSPHVAARWSEHAPRADITSPAA